MEQPSTSIRIEELMAHDAWLRHMVTDLVEPDLVEDIVQETFLAAWLKGSDVRNLPGFLRRVGRNLALKHRRSEGRRRRREAEVAAPESLPSTGQMLERLQAHRLLTKAVMDLQEPYRTTVLLRYFENVAPAEIARRQNVTSSTVRTRLARGLAQLRGRLESEGVRDPRSLAVLFLWPTMADGSGVATTSVATKSLPPLTRLAATLFSGAVFMTVYAKSSALVGLLVLMSGVGLWQWDIFGGVEDDPQGKPPGKLQGEAELPSEADPRHSDRQPLADASKKPDKAITRPPLQGQVLDTFGVPMADIFLQVVARTSEVREYDEFLRLKLEPNAKVLAKVQSDARGRFSVASKDLPAPGEVDLRVAGDAVGLWIRVPDTALWSRQEALVVAARTTQIAGQVVDPDGAPVAGAIVVANIVGLAKFPHSLENALQMPLPLTATDQDGEFRLGPLPQAQELELWVLATGFRRATVDGADKHRLIVLQRNPRRPSYQISGTVVDRARRVVAGAMVWVGDRSTRTNRLGRFRLKFKQLDENSHLAVTKKGHATTTFNDRLQPLRDGKRDLNLTLTLGEDPKQIQGKVIDVDGKPLSGMFVQLKDPLFLSFIQTGEDVALGREAEIKYAGGTPSKTDCVTDADGAFTVEGLSDRPYRLRVFHPKTFISQVTEPIAAGSKNVVVQLPTDQLHEELRGVVRSRNGEPIADVRVAAMFTTFKSKITTSRAPIRSARTDERGRFVLTGIPKARALLTIRGETLIDFEMPIEKVLDESGEAVLVPSYRCHFRVRGGDTDADTIRILDGDGHTLEIYKKTGQMQMTGHEWKLRRGRTTTLVISETAATLVYLKGKKELARRKIKLVPGQVNTIR